MKRKTYLALSLVTAGLLILLLVMAIGAQAPAHADGNDIKVPDDYGTIQAAIDAAADGDTILVASGTYTENLSITEGITLSGGWDPAFSTRKPGDSTINGNFQGRVISITGPTSDTVVTVDGFTIINGDASGLGEPWEPAHSIEAFPSARSENEETQKSDLRSPSVQVAELRTQLIALEKQGLYPGGESALQAMLDRLEWRTQQAEDAKAKAEASSVQPEGLNQGGPGAGGGIYSWNASPHLLNNVVKGNMATSAGLGYGGGIFIGQAAASGVLVSNNLIEFNLATREGEGRGGGLHVVQAPGAHIVGNIIGANVASEFGDGFGGGAYVHQAPDVIVEDNWFYENSAADGDGASRYLGVGGGLMIYDAQEAVVRDNRAERNTANAAWYSYAGAGGGMFLTVVNGAEITGNQVRDNLAAINAPPQGGGLQLQFTENALIAHNEVTANWGGMFTPEAGEMGGGGIALADVYNSTVRDNEITANIASLRGGGNVLGGGLYGIKLGANTQITSNIIKANIACYARCGWIGGGGGAYVGDSNEVEVSHNTIENNIGSLLDTAGLGGGLMMRNVSDSLVLRNLIQNNQGGVAAASSGGGLVWDSFFGWSENATVDGNLILDNQASPDPTVFSQGGGVSFWVIRGEIKFTNNVVAGNRASHVGGLSIQDLEDATLANNTIADNGDIALFIAPIAPGISTTLTLDNNIIVNHTVGISITEGSAAAVSYTLWDGNDTDFGGAGTITQTHPVTGDPGFGDPTNHDYHLTTGSAAINAGDPAGVPPAPPTDLDGVARPQGSAVDIGAYEWQGYWQFLPTVVKPVDPRTGWAIGDDESGTAAIVHTADGGLTWEAQGDPSAWTGGNGTDISAVDDQTAWAALGSSITEADGAILHTTDGGATWISQTIPAGLTGGIKGVKGLSRDEAWAASLGGVILHTTDGGSTWNIVPNPTVPITQVNRIDAMGSDVWIADAADGGAMVHSQDGGLTWRAEYLPDDDSPLIVNAFSPLAVWASGSILPGKNPSFYRTVDGGDQWDFVKQVGANDHLDDVCAASPDEAWGAANGNESSGFIWRVHIEPDGTPVAKNVTPPELSGFSSEGITCLDTRVAWVAAQNERHIPGKPLGVILHTTNGGESWVQQSAPTDIEYWKISFVGARR